MNHTEDEQFEEFPISYSIDNAILMHRDAHFGGSFDIMLDYYRKNGRGVCQDFVIERIEELAHTEQQTGKNLSPLFLSGAEMEKVARSRMAYKKLKETYEDKSPKYHHRNLIVDLILAEEEELEGAIEAIVKEKGTIVSSLIEVMNDEESHDILFPGYGQAPTLAAQCLGRIGDKRAIIALYEPIGNESIFDEDVLLDALHTIGTPAREFLLKVLRAKPITYDNERAAVALIRFKQDPIVATTCFQILHELDLQKQPSLATYLALICEGLTSPQERKEFLSFAQDKRTPAALRQDMLLVAKEWN